MQVKFISFALAVVATPCHGFLNLPFVNQANPALVGYADAQDNALLKIHFDIGQVELQKGTPVITGSRLGIDGLLVELLGKEEVDYKHPNLPGADGPNPQLSSGAKSLDILNEGKFVDLSGTRSVSLEHGVWEMVWRRDAKAGALICGFDVPEEVKRNDASIPKGRLFVVSLNNIRLHTINTIAHYQLLDRPFLCGHLSRSKIFVNARLRQKKRREKLWTASKMRHA